MSPEVEEIWAYIKRRIEDQEALKKQSMMNRQQKSFFTARFNALTDVKHWIEEKYGVKNGR